MVDSRDVDQDPLPELRELDLCYNPLSDEALTHLQPLKKLETLHLEHAGITDKGLRHLEKLPHLKQLFLDVRTGAGARTTKEPLKNNLSVSLGRTRCGLRDAGCEIDVSIPRGRPNVASRIPQHKTDNLFFNND